LVRTSRRSADLVVCRRVEFDDPAAIVGDESQLLRYLGFHTAADALAYQSSQALSIAQAYHPGVSRATNSSSTFRDNFETLMPCALAIARSLSRVCSDTRTCTTGECF